MKTRIIAKSAIPIVHLVGAAAVGALYDKVFTAQVAPMLKRLVSTK